MLVTVYVFMNGQNYLRPGRAVSEGIGKRLKSWHTDILFADALRPLYKEREVTTLEEAEEVALQIIHNYYEPIDRFGVEWV